MYVLKEGHTALHVAVDEVSSNYDRLLIDTLLLAGADVNKLDKVRNLLCQRKSSYIVQANVRRWTLQDGRTPLKRLLDRTNRYFNLWDVTLLLDFGSDVNLCAKVDSAVHTKIVTYLQNTTESGRFLAYVFGRVGRHECSIAGEATCNCTFI